MSLTAMIFAIATIFFLVCGIYVWFVNRKAVVNRIFLSLCITLAFTSGPSIGVYATHHLATCLIWDKLTWIGWCFYPSLTAIFAVILTEKPRLFVTRRYFLLFIFPAVIFFLRSQCGVIDIARFASTPQGTFLPIYSYSNWGVAYHIFEKSSVLFGLLVLAYHGLTTHSKRERKQALLIVACGLLAISLHAVVYLAGPDGNLDMYGAMGMVVVAVGIAYAITRFKFIVPSTTQAVSYVLAQIRDMVILTDLQGNILQANTATYSLLGWSPYELIAQPLQHVVADAELKAITEIRENESTFHQVSLLTKAGEHIPVDLTSSNIVDDFHDTVGRIYIGRDLRSIKQLEHEVRVRQAAESALRSTNDRLATAVQAKDDFLASMSHEFRTPLTSILGLSEALRLGVCGELHEKQLTTISIIEESGHHLLHLINETLDLSKIEAGKMDLHRAPVDVHDICHDSIRLIEQSAQQKSLKISCAVDDDLTTIMVDPHRLKQMLVNLLSNAIKFTPDGGEIGIDVTGNRETTTVEFSVWDHGIGISHERIRELFQPFVQLDNRLSRKYSGTGLGLSLVQRMAELHGGSVSVESNIGTGSRFSILLPWDMPRQYSTEPIKPHKPAKLSTAEKPAYSSRILVAEDNAAIRNLLVDFLSKRGYCVTTAINGEEAVAVTVAEH
ncbi:MAG TPA: ATP-binding protein, partial [Armatimonadota bacterium]|nr:ATP-binding protein [Armatimonadota bacterium]